MRIPKKAFEAGSVALLFLLYALLKRDAGATLAGDQGVYYYASWLWTQGILPHRDFFLSHSPLQLLPPTGLMLLFGLQLPLLNALPAVIGGFSGMVVFSMTKRLAGFPVALLATAFFLFSYANLSVGSHYTGQELALLFLLLAVALFLGGGMLIAGILLGIAASTAINVIVALPVLCALLWKQRSELYRFAAGFAAAFVLIHLVFVLSAGPAFPEQVYLYHALKPAGMRFASKMEVMGHLLKAHALVVGLALLQCVWRGATAWRPVSGSASANACVCIPRPGRHGVAPLRGFVLLFIPLSLLFLLSLNQIFLHYALPLVPFVAIAAALAVPALLRRTPGYAPAAGIALALLFLASAIHTGALARRDRSLMAFDHAREIAAFLGERLRPEETLYGDFGVAPTVALLSGRRIAAHEIDSSVMRLRSGVARLNDVIAAIEADNVGAVLTRVNRAIGAHSPFRAYLERNYVLERIFRAPGSGTIVEVWLKTERSP